MAYGQTYEKQPQIPRKLIDQPWLEAFELIPTNRHTQSTYQKVYLVDLSKDIADLSRDMKFYQH